MTAGYVYVLANSSMPGLVKVGKTTRLPSERAEELSGVTGVATPFIVVYEEHFEDCDTIEAHVHTALATKGLRLSDNREFFRAAVSDVVKIIVSAGVLGGRRTTAATAASDELSGLLSPDSADLEDFRLDGYRAPAPWDALMNEAFKHYHGTDGYIQDYAEAFKLYRDAARLGCPEAYRSLGEIYYRGESVGKDYQRALEFYKEGAKRGNYSCYAGMAELFLQTGHIENARKAFSKFISGGEADSWKLSPPDDLCITRMIWILVPPVNAAQTDKELLSIAQAYFPQLRKALQKNLGPDGLVTRMPALKAPLTALLDSIESQPH